MRSVLESVLAILCPLTCGGCGLEGKALCDTCLASFSRIKDDQSCPLCGREMGTRAVCGSCMSGKRYYSAGHFGFSFEGNLREALHSFKYNGRKDVGRLLVHLLSGKILAISDMFEIIIPLPVTEKRLKERGFNQSYIISEEIGRITKRPVVHSVMRKTKHTPDQASLTREERKHNVKDAFSVRNAKILTGRKILLVDDLFTTGNTAAEASKTLHAAGPDSITFFALARTPS